MTAHPPTGTRRPTRRSTARRLASLVTGVSLALTLAAPASAAPAAAGPFSAASVAAAQSSAARPTSAGIDAFVRAAYTDFVGRSPSVAERAFWGARIQTGTGPRSELTVALSTSPEWVRTVISGFYRDTLGREPDAAGLAYWTAAARAGTPVAEIAAFFYASDEYFRTVGRSDAATWVRALYRALLLREGEAGGVGAWVGMLGAGTTRHQVTMSFYQSLETVQLRITTLYRALLGRAPDPSGLASWPATMRARGDLALAASLADSPEYFDRAGTRFAAAGHGVWVEVVGTGTPGSCTSAAVAAAVRDGGVVEFDCGPAPVTITLDRTLVTCNTDTCAHPWQGGTPVDVVVVDGGGLVTLSGGGARGIYYANSCQESFGWLSSRCDLETRPRVVLRNLTFASGNAQTPPPGLADVGGGGAIAMRGGTLLVEDSVFTGNTTVQAHSDWGGGAVRVTGMVAAATLRRCTFTGNTAANGGAVSALGAPVVIEGSTFTGNRATGSGASSGLGGNGGAIYFDGGSQDVRVTGSVITGNVAPEGGSGIFYVSNNRGGLLTIDGSTVTGNTGERFWTSPYHDIFYLGRTSLPAVSGSRID